MREVRLGDRYVVGRAIGRGGMGQVMHARDLRLGRDVAVKVLHLGASSEADRLRFEREARAAARVNHPNVVAVYDVGEHDDEVFIVMECLPGNTLADEIALGPLPIARVERVAGELLAALAAAHEQGVLHRDIKPSNVLFARDGTAKLGDFGIAKTGDDADLTEIGSIVGTAAYLAPERLYGEPGTAAGDLYSVGVLLYEALTGTRPFAGATPVAVAHAVSTTDPAPVAVRRPDCPPALAAAITRAMQKDPAARFASASTMADAITGGSATVASVPAIGAIAATQAMPTVGIGLAASTSASASATTVQPADELPPTVAFPPAAPADRPSRAALLLVGALVALVAGIVLVGVLAARPGDQPPSTPPTTAVATDSSTTVASTAPPTTPPTTAAPTTSTAAPAPPTTAPPPGPADAKPGKGKGKGKDG